MFAILVCGLLAFSTNIQAQKIAHLNSMELLSSLTEWKAAEKQLETYASQLQKDLEAKEKKLVADYQSFMQRVEQGGVTPVEQQQKADDFRKRQMELEQEQMGAQQKLMKKEQELSEPIKDKVVVAIEAVAKAEGYTYVLDMSVGSVLYADPGADITTQVRAKL